jgi:uncharacterized caspase-like protein
VIYEVMTTVPSGGSYVVVAQKQDWYKIQLSDGREGWIHRFYLVPHEPAAQMPPVPVVASTRDLPSHTALPTAFDLPSRAQSPAVTPSRPAETGTAPPLARRTALVIGNAAYAVGPLQNAGKDATDIAAMLRRLSFEVIPLRNASLQEMEAAVNAFNLRLRQGGMGLFYFAGHGVQVDGENYLIPINARIARQQDVRYQALPMGRIIGAMEDANNGLNILILDACRDMLFSRSWRSSQVGLAPPPTARGMLIAYATAPGGVAADGAGGENGVYTKHLLQAMMIPGLSIEQVFKQVRYGVVAETGGKQIPWESSSLQGDLAFMPAQADAVPAGAPSSPASASDPETVLWSMSERSSHPEDVLAFLQAYPESRFAPAARLRLQQLQQQSATASNVPSTPSAPPQRPIERGVPSNVSSDNTPHEEAGRNNPMERQEQTQPKPGILVAQEDKFIDCRERLCDVEDIVRALQPPPMQPPQSPTIQYRGIPTTALPAAAIPAALLPKTAVALNVYFATNSDRIAPKYYPDLDKLGAALTQLSSTVEISGHTDNIRSEQANQRLSAQRAQSIKHYLVHNFSISPDRLIAKGYGASRPRATNDTPEGRNLNRRIEIARIGS